MTERDSAVVGCHTGVLWFTLLYTPPGTAPRQCMMSTLLYILVSTLLRRSQKEETSDQSLATAGQSILFRAGFPVLFLLYNLIYNFSRSV